MEKEFLAACLSGKVKYIEKSIKDGMKNIDINYEDEDGDTALHLAAGYGHEQVVKKLLTISSININIANSQGILPLHAASRYGHNSVIAQLIEHGADVNTQQEPDGQTSLYMACKGGHMNTVEFLIQNGGDVRIPCHDGLTLLYASCMEGHVELIDFLLGLGFDINSRDNFGQTPLYLAAQLGQDASVRKLLQREADPCIAETDGNTPLHVAIQEGKDACVELLIASSNNNHQAGITKYTPLIQACQDGRARAVALLLNAGADMSIRSKSGKDALEIAAEEGNIACVHILLQHGADVRWEHDESALQLAKYSGRTEVINMLGDYKENPEKYKGIKYAHQPDELPGQTNKCAVYQTAQEFITAMGLSVGYFDTKYNVCFCPSCHTARGDNLYYSRGEPPKIYGLPIGWVKLGLKIPARATVAEAMNKWHVAFHGTKVPNVEQILRTGDFLKPGDVTPEGTELRPPPGHFDDRNNKLAPPPGFDIYKIYLSPSIRYSGCDVYAPLWSWTDSRGVEQHIKVAFQVRIEPGTYEIGPQTVGAKGIIDPRFSNSELEWSTKRRGVTVLVGLLVKVEATSKMPGMIMRSLSLAASGPTAVPQPDKKKADKSASPTVRRAMSTRL